MSIRDPGARSRWLEIAISVGLSIATSATVVSWRISATLATFEAKTVEHDQGIEMLNARVAQVKEENGAQNVQIAVANSQFSEVLRRLDTIERKIDRTR